MCRLKLGSVKKLFQSIKSLLTKNKTGTVLRVIQFANLRKTLENMVDLEGLKHNASQFVFDANFSH